MGALRREELFASLGRDLSAVSLQRSAAEDTVLNLNETAWLDQP